MGIDSFGETRRVHGNHVRKRLVAMEDQDSNQLASRAHKEPTKREKEWDAVVGDKRVEDGSMGGIHQRYTDQLGSQNIQEVGVPTINTNDLPIGSSPNLEDDVSVPLIHTNDHPNNQQLSLRRSTRLRKRPVLPYDQFLTKGRGC
ncbi:hypothetical protein ACOME3_008495 [Neoechinorhynchus agilis]